MASGIDAQMIEGGTISGTVTSETGGEPIEGITVCAELIGSGNPEDCASTDVGGNYTITGLSSGSYDVVYFFSGCWRRSSCPRLSYVAQYYSGKASRAEAEPVSVIAEGSTTGIDAQMATGGQIAGRVTNVADNASIEGIEVCASRYSHHELLRALGRHDFIVRRTSPKATISRKIPTTKTFIRLK